jgi:hypothetical protein
LVSKDSLRTKDGEEYSLRKDWDFFNDDGGDFWPPPPPPGAEGIGAVPLSASPSVISKFWRRGLSIFGIFVSTAKP